MVDRLSKEKRSWNMSRIRSKDTKPEIITICASTGGPNALSEIIPKLPSNIDIPIIIVQHMPPIFTQMLAESLDKKSELSVLEAKSELSIESGVVYIAPGAKQMKIISNIDNKIPVIKITDDPPENHCKPSADYLLRSVAKIYKDRAMGIILTGMGNDGVLGLRLMKRNKSIIFAQDEESSAVFGMPFEAIKAGVVDKIIPLNKIAENIIQMVQNKHA